MQSFQVASKIHLMNNHSIIVSKIEDKDGIVPVKTGNLWAILPIPNTKCSERK